MLFGDKTYKMIHMHNTFSVSFPQLGSFSFPFWFTLFPLCMYHFPLFYLLGDLFFGDRGANIHPLSSLVSDQLFTPCFLTLPNPSRRHPWFMLHVYIDDITTSATLSDTGRMLCVMLYSLHHEDCFFYPFGKLKIIFFSFTLKVLEKVPLCEKITHEKSDLISLNGNQDIGDYFSNSVHLSDILVWYKSYSV